MNGTIQELNEEDFFLMMYFFCSVQCDGATFLRNDFVDSQGSVIIVPKIHVFYCNCWQPTDGLSTSDAEL